MRPDVRRAATATLGIAVILLAANAVRMSVDRARAQALPTVPPGAVVVPYTVVLSEVVVNTSGATKPGPSQTWAMRSDGASALKIGDGEKSTRLLRFPDGTRIEVSDWLRAKSTVSKPYERPWLRDPRKSCAYPLGGATADAHESAPAMDVIQGHRAARIARGQGTFWYALDAGCALIKRTRPFESGGASHLELVSLIPGDPSPALFAAPADYREAAPSAFLKPPEQCDAACADSRRRLIERLDETYNRYRVR